MDSIDIVLNEEYERQKKLAAEYEATIKKLPKGSLSTKTISGKKYIYLKKWIDGKTATDYIGKKGSEAALNLQAQILKRSEIEQKLKKALQLITKMGKGIRATN